MNRLTKKQSIFAVLFIAIAFSFCWTTTLAQAQPIKKSKQPLRVLFVAGTVDIWGNDVDPDREVDFRKFLEDHFVSVKTCKNTEFTPEMAQDADVIIVDGDIRKRVPADFRRPMILLGAEMSPLGIPESRGYKLQNL